MIADVNPANWGTTADWVTGAATIAAAVGSAFAIWFARSAARSAKDSAAAAKTSAKAAVELVDLERERFAIEQTDRSPAELRVSHKLTNRHRRVDVIASNAGPAAAHDVVVDWLDPQSRQPADGVDPVTLTASRLAPEENLASRAWVPVSDRLTLAVHLSWRDSRGPQSREEILDISY